MEASDTTPKSKVSSRVFLVRLIACVVLVNLLVTVFSGALLYQVRENDKERVKIHTQNLSKSLEQSIFHIIEKADVALHSAVEQAEMQIARGGIDGRTLGDSFFRLLAHVSEIQGLRMTNAKGDVRYGTGLDSGRQVNIADRAYFIQSRDNPKDCVIISEPVVSRVDKKWVIVIARRVNEPDGSFAGVAYGVISIDYFLQHFSTFDIGSNGSISLFSGDLINAVRYPLTKMAGSILGKKVTSPEFREQLKENIDHGTFTARSQIDNVERTYSYRKINGYPLYISVGLATSDYLSSWEWEARQGLLLVATFMATSIVAAWLVFRNWKDKKKAQEEVKSYYEHLEEAVKERTSELEAFNYTVSHDLRKPITVISGYCGVIEELYADKLDTAGRQYLRNIENGVNRMSTLIDTLLTFSRLAGYELKQTRVNLSDLALEIASSLRVTDPSRRVEFRIARGITATGDRNLLQIVLENLLGNAWKYTHRQEEAGIEFGVTEVKGQTAYFIRDNGPGFDMKFANEIFIPFRRLPETEECSGHGIGLATVEKIIKRHGGRIWAEGEPGKGAAFFFTL